jgi:hypothetical protein
LPSYQAQKTLLLFFETYFSNYYFIDKNELAYPDDGEDFHADQPSNWHNSKDVQAVKSCKNITFKAVFNDSKIQMKINPFAIK